MGNSARKYIDLIFATSSKWANWDPPHEIKVGDYGTIDKKTGQLEKDGNIYDDLPKDNFLTQYPPNDTAQEETFIICSQGVEQQELGVEAKIEIAGIAGAVIKGRWKFGRGRGALLIMARPRGKYIPQGSDIFGHLSNMPKLKNKVLVTAVHNCPAYSLYLSGSNEEAVTIALVSGTSVATGSDEHRLSWSTGPTGGVSRKACDQAGRYCYTPLYTIKKMRDRRQFFTRGDNLDSGNSNDEFWEDVKTPWSPLDDDGEENFVDTVFD